MDCHQQCTECKSSAFNVLPCKDSSLAGAGISQGLHEKQGPLHAVFYTASALGQH